MLFPANAEPLSTNALPRPSSSSVEGADKAAVWEFGLSLLGRVLLLRLLRCPEVDDLGDPVQHGDLLARGNPVLGLEDGLEVLPLREKEERTKRRKRRGLDS